MRKQKTTKKEKSLCWLEKLLSGWKFNLEFRVTHNTIISPKVRECFHRFTKGQRIIPSKKPYLLQHKATYWKWMWKSWYEHWLDASIVIHIVCVLKVVAKTISLPFPPQQSRQCNRKYTNSVVHQSQLCRRLTYSLVSGSTVILTPMSRSKNQTQSVKN